MVFTYILCRGHIPIYSPHHSLQILVADIYLPMYQRIISVVVLGIPVSRMAATTFSACIKHLGIELSITLARQMLFATDPLP